MALKRHPLGPATQGHVARALVNDCHKAEHYRVYLQPHWDAFQANKGNTPKGSTTAPGLKASTTTPEQKTKKLIGKSEVWVGGGNTSSTVSPVNARRLSTPTSNIQHDHYKVRLPGESLAFRRLARGCSLACVAENVNVLPNTLTRRTYRTAYNGASYESALTQRAHSDLPQASRSDNTTTIPN